MPVSEISLLSHLYTIWIWILTFVSIKLEFSYHSVDFYQICKLHQTTNWYQTRIVFTIYLTGIKLAFSSIFTRIKSGILFIVYLTTDPTLNYYITSFLTAVNTWNYLCIALPDFHCPLMKEVAQEVNFINGKPLSKSISVSCVQRQAIQHVDFLWVAFRGTVS